MKSTINQKVIEYALYISLLIPLGFLFIALSGGYVHETAYTEAAYFVMIIATSIVIYSFRYAGIRAVSALPFAVFAFLFGHFWFWFDPSADYELGWLLVFPIAGFVLLGTLITGILFGIALWKSKIKWSKFVLPALILLFATNVYSITVSAVLSFILASILEKKRAYFVFSVFLILSLATAGYSYKANGTIIDFSSSHSIGVKEFQPRMEAAIKLAIETKDLSACVTTYSSQRPTLEGARIQECIRTAYPQINDPFACKNIKDSALKGMCVATAVSKNPDIKTCDQITTYYPEGRIQCILNVALLTNNPEICNTLSPQDKTICLNAVKH